MTFARFGSNLLPVAWTACFALLFAAATQGSTLQVSPVRIFLDPEKMVESLQFQNPRQEAITVQAELEKWTQKNGENVLVSNDDLVVAPRQFSIPPGGEQIVRIGFRERPNSSGEVTYRVAFSEVPSAAQIATGLQFALRLSLPIFFNPQALEEPRIEARIDDDGTSRRLVLTNPLRHHVRLLNWRLLDAEGGEIQAWDKSGAYLLSGSSLVVEIESSATDASQVEFRASRGKGVAPVRRNSPEAPG